MVLNVFKNTLNSFLIEKISSKPIIVFKLLLVIITLNNSTDISSTILQFFFLHILKIKIIDVIISQHLITLNTIIEI
jgi:hypothetical protein